MIKLILDQPSNAVSWFSNKFLGGGRRGAAPTPPESYFGDSGSSHSSQQPIDMSNKGRTRPGTVALDVPLLLDLTHSEEEEENDEVKILEERVTSPEDRDPSPIKFGTMSYGPLFQRQYGFEVVTKERRQKERLQAQPKTIYEQVRKSKLTASKKPSVNHAFWLSKVSTKNNKDAPLGSRWPLQKTSSFKSKGTPKVDIKQAYNRDDFLKYASILFGNTEGVEANPNAFPSASKNKLFRKSLFSSETKKDTKNVAEVCGAIIKNRFKKSEKGESSKKHEVITLKDDDEYDHVEASLRKPGFSSHASANASTPHHPSTSAKSSPSPSRNFQPKNISDPDQDVIEIIDARSPRQSTSPKHDETDGGAGPKRCSFKEEVQINPVTQENYLSILRSKYVVRKEAADRLINEEKIRDQHNKARVHKLEKNVEERLRRHLKISDVAIEEPPTAESSESEEEDEDDVLPEITDEMAQVINYACQSQGEVLVDAHTIKITRKDIDTLKGLNWLNDEVINFYMAMIVQRGNDNDNFPKIYATNTFFYPRLMEKGHVALKRWTRKVDIFAHDLMLIPVHLGMHWCLATINFKKKGVYYYDSMGGNNERCLSALLKYLEDEHLDKKKAPLDPPTSAWEAEIVKDIPQQMNGSDCGMFASKFAEYLSRNAPISFTQADMPYFRKRMIWEIVKNTLLHP